MTHFVKTWHIYNIYIYIEIYQMHRLLNHFIISDLCTRKSAVSNVRKWDTVKHHRMLQSSQPTSVICVRVFMCVHVCVYIVS